jgi:hypothetical protein
MIVILEVTVQSSKLLLALVSKVILGSSPHGAHDHILLCGGSGRLLITLILTYLLTELSPS